MEFETSVFPILQKKFCLILDKEKSVYDPSNNTFVLRSNISGEEVPKFVEEFSTLTNTNWILHYLNRNKAQRVMFHKSWICHHSALGKKAGSQRNANCSAKLDILIKKCTKNTKKKDTYLKMTPPMPAVIKLHLTHSHSLDSADVLQKLRVSAEIKEQFFHYFSDGFTAGDALRFHKDKILSENSFKDLANASLCPTSRQVYHLYDVWRAINYGPIMNPFDKLKEKMNIYTEKGATVKFHQESTSWAVLVVTPVMKRAQMLPSAEEVIFVDSTSSTESTQSSTTVMLTATKIGAIPIAVLIHEKQTTEAYCLAFQLLNENFPNCFGGKKHPAIFMSDDSTAEKAALLYTWPDSIQLLCQFHVAQAEWRFLSSKGSDIPLQERPRLMKLFQSVMYAKSEEDVKLRMTELLKETYPKFVNHFLEKFQRRAEWVSSYRMMYITRNQNTNNYAEATIRILKDVILYRNKAYNLVALVDFCVVCWETYLITKVLEFAYNRKAGPKLLYRKLSSKMINVSHDQIIQIQHNVYAVPSESERDKQHIVDANIGTCTCPVGQSGAFCKHMCFLHKQKKLDFPCAPPITHSDRHSLGVLALGDKCPPPAFFLQLCETGLPCNQSSTLPEEPDCLPDRQSCAKDPQDEASMEEKGECFAELNRLATLVNQSVSRDLVVHVTNILRKIKEPSELKNLGIIKHNLRQKKIKVQPTSISRRRPGLARGAKRVCSGRPCAATQKIIKKARNLAQKVQRNGPKAVGNNGYTQ